MECKMLQLTTEVPGGTVAFHPTLIWDEESAVVVDGGLPGHGEQLRNEIEKAGVPLEKVRTIIITHQDLDHIGGLPELIGNSTQKIDVFAHGLDKSYIEGTLHLIKTDPKKMSKEQWEALPAPMQAIYKNPPKVKVTESLEDNQTLNLCGGIKVIHTPGHTPGHTSLYLEKSKTLIAGDAMICTNGQVRGPVRQNTPDAETAIKSLEKFLDYDIETVICYHGGISTENVMKQLRSLVDLGMEAIVG